MFVGGRYTSPTTTLHAKLLAWATKMTEPSSAAILEQLQQPSSHKQLIAALKTLKNEVIGRPQNKRMWVELGVLEHVAIAASSERLATAQIQGQEHTGDNIENECIKLQALAVLGSLASGTQ